MHKTPFPKPRLNFCSKLQFLIFQWVCIFRSIFLNGIISSLDAFSSFQFPKSTKVIFDMWQYHYVPLWSAWIYHTNKSRIIINNFFISSYCLYNLSFWHLSHCSISTVKPITPAYSITKVMEYLTTINQCFVLLPYFGLIKINAVYHSISWSTSYWYLHIILAGNIFNNGYFSCRAHRLQGHYSVALHSHHFFTYLQTFL